MYKLIDIARQKLSGGAYTCVVLMSDGEYCSHERGVKPLISLLQSGRALGEAVAADKTVGAGAAHLYVLLGVRAIWANVISDSAVTVLQKNGIEVFYDTKVPYIINRQKNGMCPIESAVADAKTSEEAYIMILKALDELKRKQTDTEENTAAVKIFKALADDNRLEIMRDLTGGAKCGCELLEALKIGQPTLSHHMSILCEAGLVDSSKRGKRTQYSLSAKGSGELRALVERYASVSENT